MVLGTAVHWHYYTRGLKKDYFKEKQWKIAVALLGIPPIISLIVLAVYAYAASSLFTQFLTAWGLNFLVATDNSSKCSLCYIAKNNMLYS